MWTRGQRPPASCKFDLEYRVEPVYAVGLMPNARFQRRTRSASNTRYNKTEIPQELLPRMTYTYSYMHPRKDVAIG